MNNIELPVRATSQSLPPDATEQPQEAAIAASEAEALMAENRSHHWAPADTTLLAAIRTGLERPDS